MQKLRQNVAYVDTLTGKHNIYIHTVFVEQGQVACSKQPRGKRASDMCEIIIKHELCMGCKVKKVSWQ